MRNSDPHPVHKLPQTSWISYPLGTFQAIFRYIPYIYILTYTNIVSSTPDRLRHIRIPSVRQALISVIPHLPIYSRIIIPQNIPGAYFSSHTYDDIVCGIRPPAKEAINYLVHSIYVASRILYHNEHVPYVNSCLVDNTRQRYPNYSYMPHITLHNSIRYSSCR